MKLQHSNMDSQQKLKIRVNTALSASRTLPLLGNYLLTMQNMSIQPILRQITSCSAETS